MPPQLADPETLDILKDQATARARDLGHHLQVFRTAKHDPLCYVSFCMDCREMVIVNLGKDGDHGSLFGYALEARCHGRTASAVPRAETAQTR